MHHIQKDILLKLAHAQSARFADLKPAGLDSNIFTYHLKQLIAEKLVAKTDAGDYCLTQKGKLAVINVRLDKKAELEQAHCVLYMTGKNANGDWLLRERLVHPAYGKVGFMHAEPVAGEPIEQTAQRVFKDRSGLDGDFYVRGSGYLTLMRGDELESYTQFTLLCSDNISGDVQDLNPSGRNFWHAGNFSGPEMFPNMPELIKLLTNSKDIFFAELNHQI